jgi:hypothetical protein
MDEVSYWLRVKGLVEWLNWLSCCVHRGGGATGLGL